MAVGQGALASETTLARMRAAELRLECDELDRGALHVRTLRNVLELNALLTSDGSGLAAVSEIALSLSASEARAAKLLTEALGLAELPGAFEAVEAGLLTVEQSATVVTQLAVLDLPGRVAVWQRLKNRLIADDDAGIVTPPARLAERLRKWVIDHDREAAAQRRRKAENGRRVEYRKREDGLWDLFAFGFRGSELQAILQRVQKLSAPFGSEDDRTADQRRFDALSDLLLGRIGTCSGDAATCGCRPGEGAPCGADMPVFVPIGAAQQTTDEVAELVGHGPIEPDLLEQLLLASPVLRAVFVDQDGVPVATNDTTLRPDRGDPESVRQALVALSELTPTRWFPRHPADHDAPAPEVEPQRRRGGSLRRPQLAQPHPPDTPGAYKVPPRLRRFLTTRSPLCEFPGCGVRAMRCDIDHDRAHPDGPTCACNLGPLCRRHHQVKQLLWDKARAAAGAVVWTSATGRTQVSPSQHQPPEIPTRRPPPLPTPHPFDELSPWEVEEELWWLELLPDDPDAFELRAPDIEHPDEVDPDRAARWADTSWSQDLHNPYLWAAPAV